MGREKAAYAAAAAARRLRGRKAAEKNGPLRWRTATEREKAEAQERADDVVGPGEAGAMEDERAAAKDEPLRWHTAAERGKAAAQEFADDAVYSRVQKAKKDTKADAEKKRATRRTGRSARRRPPRTPWERRSAREGPYRR